MTCGAVVLAAGASRRLGAPKQLVEYGGRPLVVHAAEAARAAGCDRVVVVTGAEADGVAAACASMRSITLAFNADWSRGQGTSVATGIAALRADGGDVRVALLLTCDQPLIPAEHLRTLVDLVADTADLDIAATRHADGAGGVPACFDRACFDDLAELDGPAGARSIIRDGRRRMRLVAAPAADFDVDTPADLARLRL